MSTGKKKSDLERKLKDWEAEHGVLFEQEREYYTDNGFHVKRLYTPLDLDETQFEYIEDLGLPGNYPFTRGSKPNMYRGKLFGMSQVASFSTPEESNRIFKQLLTQGAISLYLQFDLPFQLGYDSDHPMALGEVGKAGVSVNTLKDIEVMFEGIDLGETQVVLISNAPAAVTIPMLIVAAEKQGVERSKLSGTIQNEILKDFIARKTYVFPLEHSMRLSCDLIEFCVKEIPNFNPIHITTYQIREAGSNVIQEIAFTLSIAITYMQALTERGMSIDEFVHFFRMSILVYHKDFFEEIAKFRVMRKLWARIVKENFGAKNPSSWAIKISSQQGGMGLIPSYLPEINVVRCTLAALVAAFGGAEMIGLRTMDEPYGIPEERSSLLSLRTLQVIAHETGITATVDPLGGSYYLETLTKNMEKEVWKYIEKIDQLGGMVEAIKKGFVQNEILRTSYEYQLKVERGEISIIGQNLFTDEGKEFKETQYYKGNPTVARDQIAKLNKIRKERDNNAVSVSLNKLRDVASGKSNLIPFILDAVRQYASVGEIFGVFREMFGEYREESMFK